uniref:Uncharacterized protein n=1 Tax=Pan paniscus TaxID=9597 RepID=A0A2R9CIM7_PANPA
MKMPPGVGQFGTGSSTRVLLSLLRAEGFTGETLWGKTEEEAKQLATDDILLHQDVYLVGISISPPLTQQIHVKALDLLSVSMIVSAASWPDEFPS